MVDVSKLNKMQLLGGYFEKHFPDDFVEINKLPPKKFQEKLYWYVHGLTNYPTCPVCGKIPTFICFSQGYRAYCSRKCLNSDPNKKQRTKDTCISRYGGVAPACSTTVRAKTQRTCQERYGVNWATSSETIRKKIRSTFQKKYGVDSAGMIPEVHEKSKTTCIERYGGVGMASPELCEKSRQTRLGRYNNIYYSNTQQSVQSQRTRYGGVGCESQEILNKYLETRRQTIMSEHDFIIGFTESGEWICKCPHKECTKCQEKSFIITSDRYRDRSNDGTELCTKLLPIQPSHSTGTTIELFVRNVLDGINVEYETNKGIFDGQHADIWIPSKNIAIECNGTYYHSTLLKSPLYHINKVKNARSKGIKLLTFWSDQIHNHPEIVASMIRTKMGYTKQSIGARKCKVKQVPAVLANKFLENNHIQGITPSSVKLGLYFEDQLVSLMTFTKNAACQGSKNKSPNEWVLNRFCNKIDTRVIGGAGKLLNYFIKTYVPDSIVSFSHNDISNGELYKKLGFTTNGKINTSYYYIKGNRRYHRSTFTRAGIVRKWPEYDINDRTWTERSVMREKKYLCIYDSGTIKWTLKIKKDLI